MLVLSLFAALPEGVLRADALSGSGTKNDPFIVYTYDELQNLLLWERADKLLLCLKDGELNVLPDEQR